MTSRRQLLMPLALAPVAGWAIWATGATEPTHPVGPFHLPLDDTTALWRDLVQVRMDGPAADPKFPTHVTALNGKQVTVRGFMIPLSDAAAHNRFILAANPIACPACQRPNPATMLHVHSQIPMRESQEPVVLSGTLRLHPQEGLFYRLDRAEQRYA
ncbi:DUF3299 domain-containing protein [Azospirillum rugosum]|uniref:DUF3299 domain-containing protein n=1 Tax=Azospirillum rugosum TaxID=416170 RepID=A0ABS4SVX7_9PROT|nr:DUF3299 domain-containing protein [Azospirillum rugosum]MBP2296718.1 hypothetical protein [Azospirillum rugosum]MDQ0530469.1 hypothetical protein [Azospirillum rugosum]